MHQFVPVVSHPVVGHNLKLFRNTVVSRELWNNILLLRQCGNLIYSLKDMQV